jgi:hypothetical protein
MKNFVLYAILAICTFAAACDVQSGMTKKSLEKYAESPTPERTATPVEQIDPADILTVDTSMTGPTINVNKPEEGKKVKCAKYNRVVVNGDGKEVNIEGACQQLMVNGDKNQIKAVALTEIIVNGFGNEIQYAKYPNGKKPLITDNGAGNTIVQSAPRAAKQ